MNGRGHRLGAWNDRMDKDTDSVFVTMEWIRAPDQWLLRWNGQGNQLSDCYDGMDKGTRSVIVTMEWTRAPTQWLLRWNGEEHQLSDYYDGMDKSTNSVIVMMEWRRAPTQWLLRWNGQGHQLSDCYDGQGHQLSDSYYGIDKGTDQELSTIERSPAWIAIPVMDVGDTTHTYIWGLDIGVRIYYNRSIAAILQKANGIIAYKDHFFMLRVILWKLKKFMFKVRKQYCS